MPEQINENGTLEIVAIALHYRGEGYPPNIVPMSIMIAGSEQQDLVVEYDKELGKFVTIVDEKAEVLEFSESVAISDGRGGPPIDVYNDHITILRNPNNVADVFNALEINTSSGVMLESFMFVKNKNDFLSVDESLEVEKSISKYGYKRWDTSCQQPPDWLEYLDVGEANGDIEAQPVQSALPSSIDGTIIGR